MHDMTFRRNNLGTAQIMLGNFIFATITEAVVLIKQKSWRGVLEPGQVGNSPPYAEVDHHDDSSVVLVTP